MSLFSFKRLTLIIALLLISTLSLCLLVSCGDNGENTNDNKIVAISISGDAQVQLSDLDLDNYKINVVFSDGTKKSINLSKDYMSTIDFSSLFTVGVHNIEIDYQGIKTNWIVVVTEDENKTQETKYTITWKNYDGTVLKIDENVLEGTIPMYTGQTPTKSSTLYYEYKFIGWDLALEEVHSDVTFVAVFKEKMIGQTYTITWKNYDGTVLKVDENVEYDTTPFYDGETPTKNGNAQYKYTFSGWSPSITDVVEDITYVAQFTSSINKYTVIWQDWDETVLEIDHDVLYGELPSYDGITPSRDVDGSIVYTWEGWSPSIENVTEDITYTAIYKSDSDNYVITYNYQGGSVLNSNPTEYSINTEDFTLNNPTKDHYEFIGWTGTGFSGISKNVTIKKGSTGNRSYKAMWKATDYTISYTLNGGTNHSINPESYTVVDEINIKQPIKNGYEFLGWTGTGLTSITKNLTIKKGSYGDREYTANWSSAITYNISYNLDGGSGSNVSSYNVETSTFTLNTPTKDHYEFIGWTGTGLTENTTSVEITKGSYGNKEYTANWTPLDYNISYNLNGGSASNVSTYNIETSTFTLNNPTRNGYEFLGWTGTGLSSSSKSVTVNKGSYGNRTYTANWKIINYTISYTLNSGKVTGGNPTSYNIETENFTLNNPTRTHYDFIGWSGDGLTENTTSLEIKKGSYGNRTYTANFNLHEYSITYNMENDAIASNVINYNINSADFTLNEPTRVGYDFNGWSGTELSKITKTVTIVKGSYGDRTYTANWILKDYTITYNLNGGTNSSSNPIKYTIKDTITLTNPTYITQKTVIDASTTTNVGYFSVKKDVTRYAFKGWYKESTFQNKITKIENGTENITLYAKWSDDVYTERVSSTEKIYTRTDNTIVFGSYPQSKVTDSSIISTLNQKAGDLPVEADSKSWTSYGYYIKGNVSNYMWYIDLEEGGERYRGVYFTKYRPFYAMSYDGIDSYSYQDNNGYNINTVYWFKYEPIQWTTLCETAGCATLVCDLAIDVQQWDYDGSYTNNYKESTIRKWLNETFYNTAFDDLQKAIIKITTVDNSASSTESSSNTHACDNTDDNVYLLSYEDANDYYSYETLRQKKSTDYAKSQGCNLTTESAYLGNAYWLLRSPGNGNGIACSINYYGGISTISTVYGTDYGVVPVIQIML